MRISTFPFLSRVNLRLMTFVQREHYFCSTWEKICLNITQANMLKEGLNNCVFSIFRGQKTIYVFFIGSCPSSFITLLMLIMTCHCRQCIEEQNVIWWRNYVIVSGKIFNQKNIEKCLRFQEKDIWFWWKKSIFSWLDSFVTGSPDTSLKEIT